MMGSEIIPLDFETNAVRMVMLDGEPWWVAADVCRAVGHTNVTMALKQLDEDEKQVIDPKQRLGSSVAGGGAQMMNVVSESGLYALLLFSKLPAAKRFRRWVTGEVLPAIRRDGYYGQDGHDLPAKRAYFAALPAPHQERGLAKEAALAQVADLIAGGMRKMHALRQVADETGIGYRTLWAAQAAVYMVRKADHAAALAPRWCGHEGQRSDCHPEALAAFVRYLGTGMRQTHAYARMIEDAGRLGWSPIPPIKTMVRHATRMLGDRVRPRSIPRPAKSQEAA